MPTYYLLLCSGYIRLLYRLYKLIIIIIIYIYITCIYIYIYIYIIHICCLLHVIHTPSSQILNGGDGSMQAGGAPVFARPRTLVKAGRQFKTAGSWGHLNRSSWSTQHAVRCNQRFRRFQGIDIYWCGAWNMTLLRTWQQKRTKQNRTFEWDTHWF